jgi:hypothetical protein
LTAPLLTSDRACGALTIFDFSAVRDRVVSIRDFRYARYALEGAEIVVLQRPERGSRDAVLARAEPGQPALGSHRLTGLEQRLHVAQDPAPATDDDVGKAERLHDGNSLSTTGVTSRASSVDESSPPMMTIASGE